MGDPPVPPATSHLTAGRTVWGTPQTWSPIFPRFRIAVSSVLACTCSCCRWAFGLLAAQPSQQTPPAQTASTASTTPTPVVLKAPDECPKLPSCLDFDPNTEPYYKIRQLQPRDHGRSGHFAPVRVDYRRRAESYEIAPDKFMELLGLQQYLVSFPGAAGCSGSPVHQGRTHCAYRLQTQLDLFSRRSPSPTTFPANIPPSSWNCSSHGRSLSRAVRRFGHPSVDIEFGYHGTLPRAVQVLGNGESVCLMVVTLRVSTLVVFSHRFAS